MMKLQNSILNYLKSFLRHTFILGIFFGAFSIPLTSCGPGCTICDFKPRICLCKCGSGRKPPVYVQDYSYYVDFLPSDWDGDEEEEIANMELCPGGCEEESCDQNECGGCSSRNKDREDLLNPNQPVINEYRIAVGDVLEISVFGDQDTMVENTIVAPDGRIYYLFMDGIVAEGKTIEELRSTLESKLMDMFLAPTVSVIPRVMSKNTFTILGRVQKPGMFPLNQAITIRQALGIAGGLILEPQFIGASGQGGSFFINSYNFRNDNIPSLRNSFLVRGGKKLNIDFEKLVYSGDASQDIILKPGDYLYIASDEKREVYVLGAVPSPSAIQYDDRMTLMKALTSVGGWRMGGPYGADFQNVLILRGELDCPEVIRVDLCMLFHGEARDIFLKPGDIVYVHNKKFRFGRELVQMAVVTFIQSFVNSAAIDFSNHIFNTNNSINTR